MELRHCAVSSVLLLTSVFIVSMVYDPHPVKALFLVLYGSTVLTVIWVGLEQCCAPVSPTLFAGNVVLALSYLVFSYIYVRTMLNRVVCIGGFMLCHMLMMGTCVSSCTPKAKIYILPKGQETQHEITQVAIEIPTCTVFVKQTTW